MLLQVCPWLTLKPSPVASGGSSHRQVAELRCMPQTLSWYLALLHDVTR